MKDLSGVLTALITPFQQGEIDWVSLKKLIRFQLDGGINGFVINGTTGESPTLSAKERHDLFNFVKSETAGQVRLVVGTGTNSTADSIAATRLAATWGADAALVVVPYYNKPPQRGLFQHFQKIAECSALPVILYNVPGRTITGLECQTIAELSNVNGIIGIKEATGDAGFGARVIRESRSGFLVLSGDDGTFIDLISAGASGVISVASHILPKEFVRWCDQSRKGRAEPVIEFAQFRDLNSYLYVEANPIPIKMALHLMGLIASPETRLPLAQLSAPLMETLKLKMQEAGLV